MTGYERAQRLTAWAWAAETLGMEATAERLANIIEVTAAVALEDLRPALERVIQTEPQGFLPSPGAVIRAAKPLADARRSGAPRLECGEMSVECHQRWMDEHNPEVWTVEMWTAHNTLMERGGAYYRLVKSQDAKRHTWAAKQVTDDLGGRRCTPKFRHNLRLEFNRHSRRKFPNPDPIKALGGAG